jgi:heme/copper-type cytochrome/quinol oxidase subunit 3
MKKITLVLAGAVLLFALPAVPTYAGKSQDDGPSERFDHEGSDHKPEHEPVKMPEANTFMLLATGLTALGGLAMLKRKKIANSRQ